jgi:hypothetical protein
MLIFYDPCTTGLSRTFGARKIAFRSLNHWPKDAPTAQGDARCTALVPHPPPITATPSMFCQANGGLAMPSCTCSQALHPDEAKIVSGKQRARGPSLLFNSHSPSLSQISQSRRTAWPFLLVAACYMCVLLKYPIPSSPACSLGPDVEYLLRFPRWVCSNCNLTFVPKQHPQT